MIGIGELLIMIPVVVVALGVPVATLVGIVLVYRKVANIELLLRSRPADPQVAGEAGQQ